MYITNSSAEPHSQDLPSPSSSLLSFSLSSSHFSSPPLLPPLFPLFLLLFFIFFCLFVLSSLFFLFASLLSWFPTSYETYLILLIGWHRLWGTCPLASLHVCALHSPFGPHHHLLRARGSESPQYWVWVVLSGHSLQAALREGEARVPFLWSSTFSLCSLLFSQPFLKFFPDSSLWDSHISYRYVSFLTLWQNNWDNQFKRKKETGEMTQWLKALAILAEEPVWFAGPTWWLSTV